MDRRKQVFVVIPGRFTSEEIKAAKALQLGGTPHPTIDDAAWATIERRLEVLPRIWGRGPWVRREVEHYVLAHTTYQLRARIYRVTAEVWGLDLDGTPAGDGVFRGNLDELLDRTIAAWPPSPPEAALPPPGHGPPLKDRPAHSGVLDAGTWIASPTRGHVRFPALRGFAGSCRVAWQTEADGAPMTAEQQQAARALVDLGEQLRDDLLDALFDDRVERAEDPEFLMPSSPEDLPGHLELGDLTFFRESRDRIAYARLGFDDAWRVEHGLAALLHGARVVAVGGADTGSYEIDRDLAGPIPERAPTRSADGARTAESWLAHPHDAKVALPMWEGLHGRFAIRFVFEDEDEPEHTGAQLAAAERLVRDGDAIREAMLAALVASLAKSRGAREAGIATLADLRRVLVAETIRIHAEELDGLAYVEVKLAAPWRPAKHVRVVMRGDRVVAVTGRDGVADAIDADFDAAIREKRARKKRSPAKKTARSSSKKR